MGAFVTLNGRLTRDAKERVVKTKNGDKTIHELSIVVNTFTGGKEFGTFYTVTLWENRFSGMVPYLKKGKSLIITGSLYLNQYHTLGNESGSQLVIELFHLEFALSDTKALKKKIEEEEQRKKLLEDDDSYEAPFLKVSVLDAALEAQEFIEGKRPAKQQATPPRKKAKGEAAEASD